MKRSGMLLLVLVALFAFIGCDTPAGQLACKALVAGAAAVAGTISPSAGQNASDILVNACSEAGEGADAITGHGTADPCSPVETDDHCQACMRAMCCEAQTACGDEYACYCNVGCAALQAVGEGTASACAQTYTCGATDDTYTATIACIQNECASECSALLAAAAQ